MVVVLLVFFVVELNDFLCWDFSPINESDDSLRVLVPVAVSCHNDSVGVFFCCVKIVIIH